ncbi:MAG: hypothetical protein QG629_303 [Patescibacteria group bacterium]|nr:hypothetical protein [Candidatus Saccharibacteria bacterium]MDQ5963221.1 hypothetical protein [Patescibacteria group bacterium]
MMTSPNTEKGYIMPSVLAFIILIGMFSTVLLMVTVNNFFVVGNNVRSQQAFNIAEAGINYYLWHMAHNGNDYKDGQDTPATPDPKLGYGPYTHDYKDIDTTNTGTYTLWIKPQGNGSTIATVRSIGKVHGSNKTRTIEAQIGAASFASFGLVSDQEFWFGNSESANGPVFSNRGIHMDGPSSDTVGAANATYLPGSSYNGGVSGTQNGVWCDSRVTSPNCNTRDKSNWLFPKPSVDFNQISNALCSMKKIALNTQNATACSTTPTTRTNAYIPQYSSSGSYSVNQGYLVELNAGGSYNLYRVSGENDTASTYTSAISKTLVASNIAVPSHGVIFVEDNVWVRSNPTFSGRVTIASGRLATTYSTNITIVDNIKYGTKNGSDAIGLVAEKDVIIAPYAPPLSGAFTFEVDAAALAQSGSVKWAEYYEGTSSCTRGWKDSNQNFVFYGSVATRLNWTWNYSRGACGYNVRDPISGWYVSGVMRTATNYDYNLLYAPPPSYPVTGTYNILGWREVLTRP